MNEQLSLHGRRLLDRRSFIGTAGLSAAGLALANMLNADGLLAKEAPKTVSGTAPIRPDIDPNNPYAARTWLKQSWPKTWNHQNRKML